MDQKSKDQFADWVVREILKAKARWIHACLEAILPAELYELAKGDNQLPRVQAFCKENGYAWFDGKDKEGNGESQLRKGEMIVGTFRPYLVPKEGGGKQVAFQATVLNRPVFLGLD